MKVVFSDRAFAAVMAETTEKIKTETGGLFLGSFEDGVWYVIEAIDPGPKSIFEVAYFEYDQQYTQHLISRNHLRRSAPQGFYPFRPSMRLHRP